VNNFKNGTKRRIIMPVDVGLEVSNILGKNSKIREICRLIKMVGRTESTVLVQGESGTGKELVANAIHANSPRSKKPFIKVNCAALSETLLESELFGHKKGSFTGACETRKGRFELANGGTILLDEIGNMSFSGQAKLLRVLQEDEIVAVGTSLPIPVDVRVIATTNVILKKAVQQGAFREDLFYRLGVITIFLPPLRERKDDIPILVRNFIEFENYETKRHIKGMSNEAMEALMEYEWPGNVRELKNAIEHAVIIENSDMIQLQSLPHHIFKRSLDYPSDEIEDFNLKRRLKTYERQLILKALNKADWVKCRAAKLLGIDQRNLSYFIRKHHILDPEERRRIRGI
jgi:transcriptional regulator with PAS, ATPase and Fis domain